MHVLRKLYPEIRVPPSVFYIACIKVNCNLPSEKSIENPSSQFLRILVIASDTVVQIVQLSYSGQTQYFHFASNQLLEFFKYLGPVGLSFFIGYPTDLGAEYVMQLRKISLLLLI